MATISIKIKLSGAGHATSNKVLLKSEFFKSLLIAVTTQKAESSTHNKIKCQFCNFPFVIHDETGKLDWLRVHSECGVFFKKTDGGA